MALFLQDQINVNFSIFSLNYSCELQDVSNQPDYLEIDYKISCFTHLQFWLKNSAYKCYLHHQS